MGIDIGTSSIKTIICDVNKNMVVSFDVLEHELYSPYPGYAEENPSDWWNGVIYTIKGAISKVNIDSEEILGIGTTGMLPAFVLLDENGNVLRPSIQQSDSRVYREIDEIKSKIDMDTYFKITGCSLNQQMISPKILWMLKNEPEVFSKVEKILGSYDYINYKLTGELSVESNWALESGLFDINRGDWWEDILNILGISLYDVEDFV